MGSAGAKPAEERNKIESSEERDSIQHELSDFILHHAEADILDELDRPRTGSHLEDEDEKARAACGLPEISSARRPATARLFAKILQDRLRECLLKRSHSRIRIFEDFSLDFSLEEGVQATFTACRTTQFRRLRTAAGITEEDFISSLCGKPLVGGDTEASGKSGSLFLRSHDNKYIIKTIEEHEFVVLKEILPNYVLYLEDNTDSLLCRFYGAYSLRMRGLTLRMVVMSNIIRRQPDQIYDLKGTTEDRWVDATQHSVLKDVNFNRYSLMFDLEHSRRLKMCIKDDAEFLESIGVMDYSLLVGISGQVSQPSPQQNGLSGSQGWLYAEPGDEEPAPKVFQMGIIDYLQRWTSKKVAAHWIKKPTLGCCHEIDTEPPQKYCARFTKYFMVKVIVKSEASEDDSGRLVHCRTTKF